TSLITLPIRLGYEATRRTLHVATAAGRLVGLVGAEEPAAPVRARRRPRRRKRGMDDATLARKVETEIFRGRRAAKGKIDVNTAGGVVWLRGEAKTPQQIKQFEAKAAAVPEGKRVENLLHLAGDEAPTQIAGTAPEAEERPLTRRFTTEERTPEGEPLPKELADRGEGRQPAPLGASDDAPGGGGGGDARTAIP